MIMKEMSIGDDQWQTGRTKIFLRNGAHATLEECRINILTKKIIKIQTVNKFLRSIFLFYFLL